MTSPNGVRKLRPTAKETSIASSEASVVTSNSITVQGIFEGIIIKASDASLKATVLLFAFAFCKTLTRKTVVLARWLFAVCKFRQHNRTTRCVCNIVFHFVYRSVGHAVADNIYLDL